MGQAMDDVAIVIVPLAAQGHLNQLLHFAIHLSSRGLAVHFACSSTHNRQALTRLHGWDPTAVAKIHFHDLPLPPFSSPPPDPTSTCKFPAQLMPAFEACMQLRSPLGSLFRSLSSSARRLVVVHDPLMAFPCGEADALPNAETCRFQCVPAPYVLSLFPDELIELKGEVKQEVLDVVLAPLEDDCPPELWEFVFKYKVDLASEGGIVANTCRPIDGEFIECMARLPRFGEKKLFAIGPINPVAPARRGGDGGKRHGCLEWMDKQPRASVVYVSFGSTTAVSDEQIEQLAMGLERGGQRFVWVLRDADRGDVFASGNDGGRMGKLQVGFEEKMENVGMVVRGWAPQLEILAHPSTGAFMSHCGWNSCMESLSHGVPMIAWPMHSDQPRNALVVAHYLKVGAIVRDWAGRKEVVSAPEIERAIKRVMVSDEGREIRARAESLGEDIRLAVGEHGSSRADFDSFVAHITRA